MTPLDILKGARELLSDEARWCKEEAARASDGDGVFADDPNACQWCLEGALERVSGDNALGHVKVYDALKRTVGIRPCRFNDDPKTTHADVLRALDKAIEEMEA